MQPTHPDDEILSAHVDGQADATVEEHIRACAACAARRTELAGVRVRLAEAPPPASAAAREAAIEGALSAAAGAGDVRTLPRRDRARAFPAWTLAAAAVLLVVLGVAVAARRGSDHPVATRATATTPALSPPAAAAGKNEASAGAAAPVPVDGGDLGPVEDGSTLRSRVEPALRGTDAAGGAGAGAPFAAAARPPQVADAPPPPACLDAGQRSAPAGSQLVYRARLVWRGTPAIALAYAGGDVPGVVDVIARADCRLLASESLSP